MTTPTTKALEALRQLIACHDDQTCPAIALGNKALAALESEPSQQAEAGKDAQAVPLTEERIDEIAATVRICFGKNAGAFNDGVDAMAAELRRAYGIGSKHDE